MRVCSRSVINASIMALASLGFAAWLDQEPQLCSQKQNDRIMEEKTSKLSLQQLNDLVSDAVHTAIRKLDNLKIIDDDATDEAE